MIERTRSVYWVKAALKDFRKFPERAQEYCLQVLDVASAGKTADVAKPMKGLGAGVYEIALRHKGDAYRVIYTVQIGPEIWVIHAFQKKSKRGIKTPRHEIEVIRQRLKRLMAAR